MKNEFEMIRDFTLGYKASDFNLEQRRKITSDEKKQETKIETIKGKLGIYGQERDVQEQSLRRDGRSE